LRKKIKMAKIKVYSMDSCPWCTKLKEFLKEKNIEFEEVDVSQNSKALKEMMEKSGQSGVPQIEINGKIIVGFDEEKIEAELEKGD